MSRHKTPHLNPRNWEDVTEQNDADAGSFEKLRHRQHTADQNDAKVGVKPRQNFHRTRVN